MKKLTHIAGSLAAIALALIMGLASAGNEDTKEYSLFYGVTYADSSAIASPWIPVRGANRVVIRSWSAGTAAYTGADSQYTDSILVFNVLFSDSVSFMARDSAGSIVTASSEIPTTTAHGPTFPICADSVLVNALPAASTTDTTYKMVTVHLPPVKKNLRPRASGSGVYTYIQPALPLPGTSIYGDGSILPQYMRIRVTPVTRNTLSGGGATTPNRTKGINRLRMTALVTYKNR